MQRLGALPGHRLVLEPAPAAAVLPWVVRPAAGGPGSARHHRLGDVVVSEWEAPPFEAVRGTRQITATAGDYYVVTTVRAGRVRFEQDGGDWLLTGGDLLAWESDRPVRMTADEPVALVALMMPRRPLEAANCPLRIGEVVPGGLPATRLLHGYLDVLCPALPTLPPVAALAARNALFELAWATLQPESTAGPRALLLARRASVERYLDTRLGHAGLTPEEVAAAHNISLRTLARLFAETGETFSGVVRAKRVARVREELLTSDVSVAALAHRWGFFDTSHLNRRFRAAYGMSPNEYRARHRDA